MTSSGPSAPATRPDFTTSTFWINTGERVIRTGAQTGLALGITDATTALHLDWQQSGVAVGLAMLAALLTALAGKTVGDAGSPSFLLPAPREALEQHGRHELEGDGADAGTTPLRGVPRQLPPYDRDARQGRDL